MEHDNRPFELGKNRIEALSDGVFAIAMTLLVLEFHVPDLPSNASNVAVLPALLKLWPKFVAYAVSFISLGVYWIGHHNMYHVIRRADRVLLWLNILFFMFVSFLPFSTSVLNAFLQTQIAPLFFGINLAIIGWILFLQWAYACTQPNMLADFVSADYQETVRFRFLLVPLVTTLTIFICYWSIEISLGIYLALLPLYMIPGKFERHPMRGSEPALQDN
ncbi:MAG TPA: TMEM175 family protein [Chthonomonadaceae bacterium]|nr:TMEM175 family protein [Chthonomonadaceae bacterium]